MDTPVMVRFISSLEEQSLKRGEVLTDYGQMDSRVCIIQSGIIRLDYFDGLQEKTLAFGSPGSLFTQMHCYYLHQPAFFRSVACTDSVIRWTTKQIFDSFIVESKEFAQWVLDCALNQLCGVELKLERLNGDAYERYVSLVKVLPDVVRNVPDRVIASYLGITPAWLSQIKKKHTIEIEKEQSTDFKPFSSNT